MEHTGRQGSESMRPASRAFGGGLASQLVEIGELLKAGRIRPVIDKVFPFEQAKEALAYLEQGRAKGKVVVQMK